MPNTNVMPAVSIDVTLFWQIINFIILLILSKKFFFKPMGAFLAKRKNEISDEIENTKKDREAAKLARKEAENEIKKAKKEMIEIIKEAERKAEDRKEEIEKETKAKREKMLASAEADIIKMKEQVKKELRDEMSEIAVKLAEKMIGKSMDEKIEQGLLDQFIEEVGESK